MVYKHTTYILQHWTQHWLLYCLRLSGPMAGLSNLTARSIIKWTTVLRLQVIFSAWMNVLHNKLREAVPYNQTLVNKTAFPSVIYQDKDHMVHFSPLYVRTYLHTYVKYNVCLQFNRIQKHLPGSNDKYCEILA